MANTTRRMTNAVRAELRKHARDVLGCKLSAEELDPILEAASETDDPLAYLALQLGGVDASDEPTALEVTDETAAAALSAETAADLKPTHVSKNFARFADPARVPITVPDGVELARIEFPQALDRPGYVRRKVEIWLTPLQALALYQIQQGLMACHAQLIGAKPVENAPDAIRWILENRQVIKEEPAAA